MLAKLLQLKNTDNSVKELSDSIRQGIPSAVFGVTDAFKCFLVSTIENKVLYIARDYAQANYCRDAQGRSGIIRPYGQQDTEEPCCGVGMGRQVLWLAKSKPFPRRGKTTSRRYAALCATRD